MVSIGAGVTLAELPAELQEKICFHLSIPSDRFSLRCVHSALKTAVDSSWRNLKVLSMDLSTMTSFVAVVPVSSHRPQLEIAASSSHAVESTNTASRPEAVGVMGETEDPDTGRHCSFSQQILLSKVDVFLQWVGERLPSLTLIADCNKMELSSAPLSGVLAKCADQNVVPSVLDVTVKSCYLASDRSLLDALIRWAQQRQLNKIDHGLPLWKRLTLSSAENCYNQPLIDRRLRFERRLRLRGVEPPLGGNNEPDTSGDSDEPMDEGAKSLTSSSAKVLLQTMLNNCHSLEYLEIDNLLKKLTLDSASLNYPPTLIELVCDRLGLKEGEVQAIVNDCPLLERITVSCLHMSRGDMISLSKLSRLKDIRIANLPASAEFVEAVFGGFPFAVGATNPWPLVRSITLTTAVTNVYFLATVGHCCSTLEELNMSDVLPLYAPLATNAVRDICRLSHLRRLIIGWASQMSESQFDDCCIDNLATNCPNLEELSVNHCKVNPVSIPQLLRECPKLTKVSLNIHIRLSSLDSLVMVRSAAADIADRSPLVMVNVSSIGDCTYKSVERIVDGLPDDVALLVSDFADFCLHHDESCARCCLEAKQLRKERRSLILCHKPTSRAVVVFTCSIPRMH